MIDRRFQAIDMCRYFGWTYEQYMQRPLWFDTFYALKLKADAKYQETKNQPHE